MDEKERARVEIDGASVHVTGEKGERVEVGPGGVHVTDGDSEVKVSWTGIRVRDGKTNLNITVWKPMIGCGVAILVFVALLTAVIVGIVKLMIR
jgi:hypothetical protein